MGLFYVSNQKIDLGLPDESILGNLLLIEASFVDNIYVDEFIGGWRNNTLPKEHSIRPYYFS